MRAMMLEVPQSLLAERRRLGHDRFDEMWEGVLHMVPPPSYDHQSVASWIVAGWAPVAKAAGMRVTHETGLFDPAVADFSSYRQPDVVVARPEHASERGVEGRAELVVEVRSPDDETYEKLPFYERVGVGEVLVVELDRSLRRWAREPAGHLVEVATGTDGWVALDALPVRMRREDDGNLTMQGPFGTTTV